MPSDLSSSLPGFAFETKLDLRESFAESRAAECDSSRIASKDRFTVLRWTRGAGILVLTDCDGIESRRKFQGETVLLLNPEARLVFPDTNDAPALYGSRLDFTEDFLCAREDNSALVAPPHALFFAQPLLKPNAKQGVALGRLYLDLAENAADLEIARSYLKILLLQLSRFAQGDPGDAASAQNETSPAESARLESPKTAGADSSAGRFREFRRLVNEHYREWHRPAQYAERMFLSTRCLSEITNAAAERSPSAIIQKRILLEARRFLSDQQLSIAAIARELGFADASYFSRFFRKHMGAPPEDFRRQLRDS